MQTDLARIFRVNFDCPKIRLNKQCYLRGGTMNVNSKRFANGLLLLRAWEQEHLPHSNSMIARDVMLLAIAHQNSENHLSIKEFHLTLGYSEDRVGEVIKKFANEGWLIIDKNKNDGRNKIVYPTEQLLILFEQYELFLRESLFCFN